ncbi:regulator of telomere elongation helicase 1 homolog [Prorops nasuta]|uniref:regulator of telomere elongation helicase 1 homolog n=1 Tax=Prorops nasuta TaxID=863751 RepID=UPI0034CD14B5
MPNREINGVIVNFPFEPYPVQEEYMAKVIECLQNNKHGVLESPTGTGKTLCLLCSSLSWLITKKAQMQAQSITGATERENFGGHFFKQLSRTLDKAAGAPELSPNFGWIMPKIIYASRTHSQLSQAMQELKRTSYKHVTTAILGSRDQLCIHPEVSKEISSYNKVHLCHVKVKGRTCNYYNNVESRKDDPLFKEEVLDIEDLVKVGQKLKCCPYFLSRELRQNADITFMPYNYLLDPKTRKSQGIDLQSNIILLDEAHNIEKICEEAASLQISSTDVANCIDEITSVMKGMVNNSEEQNDFLSENQNLQKDFTSEDLCILKVMFLELEKTIDAIVIKNSDQGETFPGAYIFELLEKAELTVGKEQFVAEKLDKIILYLSTTNNSPFANKGNALQKFVDLLKSVFSYGASALRYKDKIKECYKVHIQFEEYKRTGKKDIWEKQRKINKTNGKLISYWCFSPGFGMQQLVDQGVRSVILTSGTLSPLKPFISELEIPIDVQLENPHIVTGKQICVGVLSNGPDGFLLNSSFNTRNDPRYIASLGRTIYNFSVLIPHGLLIFFPSYPIMNKCKEEWQNLGLWTQINSRKPIYVEPQSKDGFQNIMNEYYRKIHNPNSKGAIFMAVCRGKVSEGLDFADMNGRAVLITGLPFPPLKNPRVILKQKYLEEMRKKDKNGLTGQQWYQLEASRAVNQAIGRIIRHINDYGAIILCDCRFETGSFQKELSAWLRPHIKKFTNFGMITKELREFFRYTEYTLPQPKGSKHVRNTDYSLSLATSNFNTGSTKKKKVLSSKVTENSLEEDIFSPDQYYNKNNELTPKKELDIKNISKLFESESRSVINFNSCKSSETSKNKESMKDTFEPLLKKRKMKMLPVECNFNSSQPSTSAIQQVNMLQLSDEQSEDKEFKAINTKSLGKSYLKDVKKFLSQEDFKLFSTMIHTYTKNANFDQLIRALEKLFPLNGELQHLFIGFKSFMKKNHILLFDNYIHKNK